MNAGERAAARAADDRADAIAKQTADLLRVLAVIERRVARLEAGLFREILRADVHLKHLR
jgi:hypothetical protein